MRVCVCMYVCILGNIERALYILIYITRRELGAMMELLCMYVVVGIVIVIVIVLVLGHQSYDDGIARYGLGQISTYRC
jgi:hypothetical protein